jgi:hypothetical protein
MKKFYALLIFSVFCAPHFYANYMLIQNVTTVGDNPNNKTIQVQFDISWQNSWRDDINWDAAWLFIKYKDGAGNWGHAYLNTTGYNNGTGTSNTLEVTNDNVGAFLYRSGLGSGSFTSTGIQLQWNYGQNGLNSVTGLEIQVFGIEQVYIPEGDFNVDKTVMRYQRFINQNYNEYSYEIQLWAPGYNCPVINNRLSPVLSYYDAYSNYRDSIRIKGDVGIDTDNDGVVDNTNYPIGYENFYTFKYELTEQQYADFYNTLNSTQQSTVGLAGNDISILNGKYVSSKPNGICSFNASNDVKLLSYADWCGLRPMSFLEWQKSIWGNEYINYYTASSLVEYPPNIANISNNTYYNFYFMPENELVINGEETPYLLNRDYQNQELFPTYILYPFNMGSVRAGLFASSNSTRRIANSSYYGVMDYNGGVFEPFVPLNQLHYDASNGNGVLTSSGQTDVSNWLAQPDLIKYRSYINLDFLMDYNNPHEYAGIRLCRSAP